MKRASLPSLVIPILLLILFAQPLTGQDVSLPVSPVFEGLDVHPETGVYYARFGYHNENDRVIEIPAGEDNGFGPGTEDLGQVTVFQPGRHENAFQVELDKLLPREWNLRGPDGQSRQAEAPPIKGVTKLKPIIGNRGIIDEYDPEKEVFLARLGYRNDNAYPIYLPTGPKNKVSGGPQDQGQPEAFLPGRNWPVFAIEIKPSQTKVWRLHFKHLRLKAPSEIPDAEEDESIDPVGNGVPDPFLTDPQVVDPGVEDVLTRFNELDSTQQKLIREAYSIQTERNPDGTLKLVWVDLECQFSATGKKARTYVILQEALDYTDEDSISNGAQLKLTMRLSPEVAVRMQNDDSLAQIDPILVEGEDRLMEVVQLRPRPLLGSGIVKSQADSTQASDRAREGWGFSGKGVRLGILSDSYNALGGAAQGVANGELPENVLVLKDINGSDEGRAMAEIVHDVAPGIEQIQFHTAFLSEGDFALGIRALADAGSEILVDDVTYPTAPWFMDGPISRAVDDVVEAGAIYLSSSGNFQADAAEGVFTPASAVPENLPFPSNVEVHAVDGSSDVLQTVGLDSGLFIMTLQWENEFVTDGMGGSVDDLDIYILNEDGSIRAGSQKNNLGNDPWEFFAFEVKKPADIAHVVIVRKAGSTANLKFKYIFFRSAGVEFLKPGGQDRVNASTIIAHAANPNAITVSAAPYFDRTQIEAFSSLGDGNKPDFTAPDGGNTSFFGTDFDGDLLPNFFGTSAAAPHLAGLLALLSEGYDSLALEPMTLAGARTTLESIAEDIGDPGFDNLSGHGFIRADRAMQSLGNPVPQIRQLDLLDRSEDEPTFDLGVIGDFFVEGQTLVRIGSDTLMPSSITATRLSVEVDTSLGSKPIQAINPAIANSVTDGGASEVFTATDVFYTVNVRIADAVKKYLEALPDFSTSFTVTPTVLAEGNELTAEDSARVLALLADPDAFASPASDTSSIGFYRVNFEPGELDTLETIGFTSIPGLLVIEPLEVFLTVEDLTVEEGEPIASQLQFRFDADFSGVGIVNEQEVLDAILAAYEASQSNALIVANLARGIVNDAEAPFDPALLYPVSSLISQTAFEEGGTLLENGDYVIEAEGDNLIALALNPDTVTAAVNLARGIVNGKRLFDPNEQVAIDFDDDGVPETSLARAIVNLARGIVNGGEITDGEILLNIARGIVNGEPLREGSLLNLARGIVNESQAPGDSEALSNFARGIVNEGLVEDPGSLLNLARGIVNEDDPSPEAFANFARAIVNLARAIVNRSDRAIVNFGGRAIVNGKSFDQADTYYTMIAVSDTARLEADGELRTLEFYSLPFLTGNGPGRHLVLPGSVVLTNQTALAMANADEEISGLVSLPLGNFIFTTQAGILEILPQTPQPGIKSFVWNDQNGNNIQDPGEPGIPGVEVELMSDNLRNVIRTALTDENGLASFLDLENLDGFKVRLRYPEVEGFTRVRRDAGRDPEVDSDANSDGITQPFEVEAYIETTKWDAGYVPLDPALMENAELSLREENGSGSILPGTFQAFPNPARDWLRVLLPHTVEGEGEIRIYDALGRILFREELELAPGGQVQLDVSPLKKGVYFLQVKWKDQSGVLKILKN